MKRILFACILILIIVSGLSAVSAADNVTTSKAKVDSFTLEADGTGTTTNSFESVGFTGEIVIDVSSVDDAQVKLLKQNYKKEKSSTKSFENTVGDLRLKIKIPDSTSEIKISDISFGDDKITIDVHGLIYEFDKHADPGIDIGDYDDKVIVNATFFDKEGQEYCIIAK